MLPIPVLLAYGSGMTEHLQLPDRRRRAGIQSQTHVSDDGIVAFQRDEMLRAAAGLVDQVLQLRRIGIHADVRASGLPAADAPARHPPGGHAGRHHLTDVALGYTRHDLRGRDVPLDPLDAHVFGDERLHLRQELDRRLLVVRGVFAPLPHLVDAGAGDHQEGVELQHVRTVRGIVEHPAEAFQVVLRIGSRETRHDVVADLQAAVPAVPGAPADLLGPVAALNAFEYLVIEDLHAQLHAGGPQAHGALDLLRREYVRTGFHGHPDAAPGGDRVPLLRLLQRVGVLPVQRIEAALDEPFLIPRVAAGERAAHDDQVYLVGVVPDLLQLGDPVGHLHPGIEPVPGGPPRRRLLPGVRLGGVVGDPSGTVGALPVGAVVRGRHHGHGGHAAHGAGRLLYQEREKEVPVGRLHVRQDIGVRGDVGQTVPLAELQLQILQRIPVLHGTGSDGLDEVRRQEGYRISHRGPCRRPSSSAPREPRRSGPCGRPRTR